MLKPGEFSQGGEEAGRKKKMNFSLLPSLAPRLPVSL
jgi:hypothetical protein